MAESANNIGECGICLDALKAPVALPCGHEFCSECLNGWRSRYGEEGRKEEVENRKCPLCREEIPPSREVMMQLETSRNLMRMMEAGGDTSCEQYAGLSTLIRELEHQVGDWTEPIDYSSEPSDAEQMVLPPDISAAALRCDNPTVLTWLGPHPVDKRRVNARCSSLANFTLLSHAVISANLALMCVLLQLGADVEPVDAKGMTPIFAVTTNPELKYHTRLLLEWGAEFRAPNLESLPWSTKDAFIALLRKDGQTELADRIEPEFGWRRCEVVNLTTRPDLNGKACSVEKWLPAKGRYRIQFEESGEEALVGPDNLKGRDRTPEDCGCYVTIENGQASRRIFASREECRAYVASLHAGNENAAQQLDE